jgi:hypothetical protein
MLLPVPLLSSHAGVILGLSATSAPEYQSTHNVITLPANANCNLHDVQPTQALSQPSNGS